MKHGLPFYFRLFLLTSAITLLGTLPSHAEEKATLNYLEISAEIKTNLNQATQFFKEKNFLEAQLKVEDTYFETFEGSGMEAAIGTFSGTLKVDLENQFNLIRSKLGKQTSSIETIQKDIDQLTGQIEAISNRLETKPSFWELLFSALLIMLREGFEAVLIIGAITALLIKSGNAPSLSIIRSSVGAALVASLLTAVSFKWIFHVGSSAQELLEGLTMLVACIMLFIVGHWLIGQAESKHWISYIQENLKTSINTQNRRALWWTSFLAVYREGAETVLFYEALWNTSDKSEPLSIAIGFLLGAALVFLIYLLFKKGAVKIPMNLFFKSTSALLYVMSFIFAGNAVIELQAGGYLPVYQLDFAPSIPFLGIYPNAISLLIQVTLILVFIISMWPLLKKRLQNQPHSNHTGAI